MKTLIEELREWDSRYCDGELPFETREIFYKILSRHEQEEPLAVLADRKGCKKMDIHPKGKLMLGEWAIEVWGGTPPYVLFSAPTYSECEAQARAYLNGLTDKEGIK